MNHPRHGAKKAVTAQPAALFEYFRAVSISSSLFFIMTLNAYKTLTIPKGKEHHNVKMEVVGNLLSPISQKISGIMKQGVVRIPHTKLLGQYFSCLGGFSRCSCNFIKFHYKHAFLTSYSNLKVFRLFQESFIWI